MSEPDEFADMLHAKVLAAYGLHEWDISSAAPPLRVRAWRAVTFAKRRGRLIDWAPYERAEEEARASTEAFRAALPGRMREAADQFNAMLPDGLRFEWTEGE